MTTMPRRKSAHLMQFKESETTRVNVWWPWGSRGRWDHGLLIATLEGPYDDRLWPISLRFKEYVGEPPPLGEGVVIVAAGTQLKDSPTCMEVLERVSHYPWVLFCLTSDEERVFDVNRIQCARLKVWQQYKTPTTRGHHVLMGWPLDARRILRDMPRESSSNRRLRWVFAGQINHESRELMRAHLAKMDGGLLNISPHFGSWEGLSREDYFRLLAEAAIAPCPSGPVTPDNFRCYEALEAGCLPICESQAPNWPTDCWWSAMLSELPFPVVRSWDELPGLMEQYQDELVLQRAVNKATAWWLKYKRQFALDLVNDVYALGQVSSPELNPPVTVLMPTSPISLHPSTELIEDSIRRIRAYPELRDAEIIIMIDGIRDEQLHYAPAYEEYKRRLIELCNWDPDFRGCLPLVFDEFTHQASMTREALKLVHTPYILFIEHDTYPEGEIPWSNFFQAMRKVNCIRLSIIEKIYPQHEWLYGRSQTIDGVPLRQTIQWSQRPHLVRTEWYRQMLRQYFEDSWRTMIEDVLYVHLQNIGFGDEQNRRFDVWVYVPDDENITRSRTNDGRKNDPKYPMLLD